MLRCIILMLLGLGCRLPAEPEAAYRVTAPPPEWREDYDWVWKNCASFVRPAPLAKYEALRFVMVDAEEFTMRDQTGLLGYWIDDTIYLAERMQAPFRLILRHELLHYETGLMHREDWNRTPDNIFRYCYSKAEADLVAHPGS